MRRFEKISPNGSVLQEMEYGVGVDSDPKALELARAKILSIKSPTDFSIVRGSFGWVNA